MGHTSPIEQRVQELHDNAVKRLIEAHQQLDEPLLLAVRYEGEDPVDIHILEVLEKFPGGDDDELFTTEYEPSPALRILGKVYLTLASPAQIRAALRRQEPLVGKVRTGRVVFCDDSKAETAGLLRDLGLSS